MAERLIGSAGADEGPPAAVIGSFSVTLCGLPATQRLAEAVAARLRPGDVLALDGDLGAGKTTFVRFLARALGVIGPVTSPTFTLAHHYEIIDPTSALLVNAAAAPSGPDTAAVDPSAEPLLIHHIDAYRLAGDADAHDLALAELLDSGGIVVVEWAERLTLPADRLDLHFAFPPEPYIAAPGEPQARPQAPQEDRRVAANGVDAPGEPQAHSQAPPPTSTAAPLPAPAPALALGACNPAPAPALALGACNPAPAPALALGACNPAPAPALALGACNPAPAPALALGACNPTPVPDAYDPVPDAYDPASVRIATVTAHGPTWQARSLLAPPE